MFYRDEDGPTKSDLCMGTWRCLGQMGNAKAPVGWAHSWQMLRGSKEPPGTGGIYRRAVSRGGILTGPTE